MFYSMSGKFCTPYCIARLTASFTLVLGVVVLIGWYTHNTLLIQVSSLFVPMQFNTALCFIISSIGILVTSLERRFIGMGLGATLVLIGIFTLIEYIFSLDLGIDQLLMQHYITVETSNPGRMAPNTALCFSLIGYALVLVSLSKKNWKHTMAVGIFGSLILGFSIVALAGYRLSFEAA